MKPLPITKQILFIIFYNERFWILSAFSNFKIMKENYIFMFEKNALWFLYYMNLEVRN